MSAPTSRGAGNPDAILVEAKKHFRASNFKKSLAYFKMAILKCKCNKDMVASAKELGMDPKEMLFSTCHCKDFESLSLAPNADKLAMYNLATKPCTCGSGMAPCNLSTHIEALEGIAASYDKLGAHEKAYQYASMQIIMAPNALQGYLRMAKAMRLKDVSESSATKARCVWIYRQASQSVRTHGNKDLAMFKVMNSLLRKDIIASLPAELRIMILQNLSCVDLCRCMRVSKTWNAVSRDPSFWKDLEFVKRWPGPKYRNFRPNVLNDILLNRAKRLARSLVIRGMTDFGIDATKLKAIIKALPQLESLSVRGSRDRHGSDRSPPLKDVLDVVIRDAPTGLKNVHFDDFAFASGRDLTTPSLPTTPLTQTLQELIIKNVSGYISFAGPDGLFSSAVWQRLEKLEVCGVYGEQHRMNLIFDYPRLITATPALKDVSFSDFMVHDAAGASPTVPGPETWDRLERFVLRNLLWLVGRAQMRGAPLPRLPAGLRSLELPGDSRVFLSIYKQVAEEYVDSKGSPVPVSLAQLEHLRISEYVFHRAGDTYHTQACEAYRWFMDKLAPSISNGTLKSLDIPFDGLVQDAFDQVLDKNAIRTISCNALICHLDQVGLLSPEGNELIAWLDGFPNLTTVGVFPNNPAVGSMMVAKLLSEDNNIDTIYTNALTGVYRDDALKMAAEKSIRIIHADRVPEPALEPLIQQPTD